MEIFQAQGVCYIRLRDWEEGLPLVCPVRQADGEYAEGDLLLGKWIASCALVRTWSEAILPDCVIGTVPDDAADKCFQLWKHFILRGIRVDIRGARYANSPRGADRLEELNNACIALDRCTERAEAMEGVDLDTVHAPKKKKQQKKRGSCI